MNIYTITVNTSESQNAGVFYDMKTFYNPYEAAEYFDTVATFTNIMRESNADGIISVDLHKNSRLIRSKGFFTDEDPEKADANAPKMISF